MKDAEIVDPVQQISFHPRYYELIRSGTKRATTRFGEQITLGPARFVFEFADEIQLLAGTVEGIESRRFNELSDADAAVEGMASAEELREALRMHYPEIGNDADLTFVRFRLTPAQE